jgi:hypothetical protein
MDLNKEELEYYVVWLEDAITTEECREQSFLEWHIPPVEALEYTRKELTLHRRTLAKINSYLEGK